MLLLPGRPLKGAGNGFLREMVAAAFRGGTEPGLLARFLFLFLCVRFF